jgi:tetratricopeptide (TPR) repeat protein
MNRIRLRNQTIIALTASVLIIGGRASQAEPSSAASVESTTLEAANLYRQGKLQQALDLQEQTLAKNPSSGLAMAAMSFLNWKQGDIFKAINEGELAIKLEPDNPVFLINLGLMMQTTNNFQDAMTLYKRALKFTPENWVPILGTARCNLLNGAEAKGSSALKAMASRTGCNFGWYFMTAKTALENDQLEIAESASLKAIKLARTPQEKSAAGNIALLSMLRQDETEKAASLQKELLNDSPPTRAEVYVRMAISLLPLNDPGAGKALLKRAIENLKSTPDSITFLKLGRAFEEKADDSSCTNDNRVIWLENARESYANAVAMVPNSSGYHFALGTALSKEGRFKDAVEEFKKTQALDQIDSFSPFLVLRVLVNKENTASQPAPTNLDLSLVKFSIDGLDCSCKVAKIQAALMTFPEVVFINTPSTKPYGGQILVTKTTSVDDLLKRASDLAMVKIADPKGVKIKIQRITEEPVATLDAAFKVVGSLKFGPTGIFEKTYMDYINRFKDISPIIPVPESSTAYGDIKKGDPWPIPL